MEDLNDTTDTTDPETTAADAGAGDAGEADPLGAQPSIDDLLDRALAVSTSLHEAIATFDEAPATYEVGGAPGVAYFERDAGDGMSHVSGSPSPALLPVLEELHRRHLEHVGIAPDGDNSHVPPLVLLSLMLLDEQMIDRLGMRQRVTKPTEVVALTEEEGRHDPPLEPHDAALRAWVPLAATHRPDAGVHPAVVELRFRMERRARYAPTGA